MDLEGLLTQRSADSSDCRHCFLFLDRTVAEGEDFVSPYCAALSAELAFVLIRRDVIFW
jgi:hypothetical protein